MRLINCPQCGMRLSAKESVCPGCGFPLGAYLTAHPDAKKDGRRKKRIRLLFLCLLLLFLLSAAVLFLYRNYASPRGDEVSAETEVPAAKAGAAEDASGPQDPSDDTQASAEASPSPAGVYVGDDSEILVLYEDGLACYYCVMTEYTELACPWSFSEDTVRIELSKLHCSVYAKKTSEDFSELIFRSESPNWNTEVFRRIDLSPSDYGKRIVPAHDPGVTVLEDGAMRFALEGIEFTVPKEYLDLKDAFDEKPDAYSFVSIDMSVNYISSLLFCSYDSIPADPEVLARSFAERFFEQSSLSAGEPVEVAGISAVSFPVEGYFNSGFISLTGAACRGQIVVLSKDGRDIFLLLAETESPEYDGIEAFRTILAGATPAE